VAHLRLSVVHADAGEHPLARRHRMWRSCFAN
jgi:hypothetical protein